MKYYFRVVGGPVFGDRQPEAKIGEYVSDVFATTNMAAVAAMFGWNDDYWYEHFDGGLSWSRLAVIRADAVRPPLPHEKCGHDNLTDEGEVVVSGEIVCVIHPDDLMKNRAFRKAYRDFALYDLR